MASISRNIATISRSSAIRHNTRANWTQRNPLASTTALGSHGDGRLRTTSPAWQAMNTFHTRHATTISKSRDTATSPAEWPAMRGVRCQGSRKNLSTTLARQYTSGRNGGKQDPSVPNESHQNTQKPVNTDSQTNTTNITSNEQSTPSILKSIPLKVPATPKILHENIYTIPNLLTTTRVITAPWISYCLLHSQPILAFTLFAYSSITDLVDGYLARHFGSSTVLGSILDPFADKLLMTLTTITLYYIGTFPWWLALTILGRDGGLLLSALYFRWISLPEPRTMKRYWDFSLPSAEVRPTEISKINTMLQFLLVAGAVGVPVLPGELVEAWNLWGLLEGWMGLVAGTTVWSGLSYVFTSDAIRFIGRDEQEAEDGAKKVDGEERK